MKSQLLLEMHTMREKRATLVDNHARIRCETQDFQSQPVHILSTTRLLLLDAILFDDLPVADLGTKGPGVVVDRRLEVVYGDGDVVEDECSHERDLG